jgi:hypothetical protein
MREWSRIPWSSILTVPQWRELMNSLNKWWVKAFYNFREVTKFEENSATGAAFERGLYSSCSYFQKCIPHMSISIWTVLRHFVAIN